jgi:S1-C subfamily serine protease
MSAAIKSSLFAIVLTGLFGAGSAAQAAPPSIHLRLSPGPRIAPIVPIAPSSPRLGFYGHFEWGYGMIVDSVPWGTPARQMGLESGDVIVAINGQWLRSQGDYYRALAYSGEHARVTVQDVRSGRMVTRLAHLHDELNTYSRGASYGAGPSATLELR